MHTRTLVIRLAITFIYCDQCCTATIYSATCSVRGTHICLCIRKYTINQCACCLGQIKNILLVTTVVPALGDPRRERPPAVCGHFVNVPTHFNVFLPLIRGHLPNADADSHLLVVSTCYNGQCKQMPHFRWSFQSKNAGARPNLGPTVRSNLRAVVW